MIIRFRWWSLVILGVVASVLSAAETPSGTAVLSLQYQNGQIECSGLRVLPGGGRWTKRGSPADSSLLFQDASGSIHEASFRIPKTLYFDYVDAATGVMKGGAIIQDSLDFAVRVPWIKDLNEVAVRVDRGKAAHVLDLSKARDYEAQKDGLPYAKFMDNGSDDSQYVFVVLGDGYRASEISQFHDDAQRIFGQVLNASPWSEYASYVNAYWVDVVSNESGADNPHTGHFVDTALDATYWTAEIERLLTVNTSKAFDAAMSAPTFDRVLVIVNDPMYGGSGGSLAVVSLASSAPEVAIHEISHSFAGLADEYEDPYPGYPPGDPEPNVTFQTSRPNIKWNVWIEASTPLPTPETSDYASVVGVFEGARYLTTGIYRPKLDCTMRSLGASFCEVCTEAHVLSLYASPAITLILDQTPDTSSTVEGAGGTPIEFSVTVRDPDTHALGVEWLLDGVPQSGKSVGAFLLNTGGLSGPHTLTARVKDATALVRNDPYEELSEDVSWPLMIEGQPDADGDGLTNDQEIAFGTNPLSRDTDADGLSDYREVGYDGDVSTYDPYDPVTNPDGTDTNATNPDTDGDGVSDGDEVTFGSDPLDPFSTVELPLLVGPLLLALLAAGVLRASRTNDN